VPAAPSPHDIRGPALSCPTDSSRRNATIPVAGDHQSTPADCALAAQRPGDVTEPTAQVRARGGADDEILLEARPQWNGCQLGRRA
jgi:hypothetical protein